MKLLAITATLLALGLTQAQAQSCEGNFAVVGTPMLTGLTYKTWDIIAKRAPAAVLKDLAASVSAEGFADMRIDKATSSVLAIQETSGSGRPQTLRVTARKSGGGTRVDAVFAVQQGQVAPEAYTRDALCRVISGGRG
ncbi:hypothetical protein [Bosea sp. (in: a-proteobacteria)]|uniref:hypothetical protein n=1 Tax=Bosea sp. (in: a-proteobacteria) TaxID=1871050 RepID=UPI002FC84968